MSESHQVQTKRRWRRRRRKVYGERGEDLARIKFCPDVVWVGREEGKKPPAARLRKPITHREICQSVNRYIGFCSTPVLCTWRMTDSILTDPISTYWWKPCRGPFFMSRIFEREVQKNPAPPTKYQTASTTHCSSSWGYAQALQNDNGWMDFIFCPRPPKKIDSPCYSTRSDGGVKWARLCQKKYPSKMVGKRKVENLRTFPFYADWRRNTHQRTLEMVKGIFNSFSSWTPSVSSHLTA